MPQGRHYIAFSSIFAQDALREPLSERAHFMKVTAIRLVIVIIIINWNRFMNAKLKNKIYLACCEAE
jgi:hypothetical protein